MQVGAALIELEDTSKVEVRFNLRLDQLRWLWDASGSGGPVGADGSHRNYKLPPVEVKVLLDVEGSHFAWSGQSGTV